MIPARTFAALGALAALALPQPAAAQTVGKHGVLAPWILVASQYRFDGISASNNRPVLQGSLYWWRPDKTSVGVFVSQVDYRDPGKTSYEVDLYAGRHFDVKGTQVTLEAMYSAFPDNKTWGPTYDFLQTKVKARRSFEKLTLGGNVAWSPQAPYGSGEAWRVEAEAAYAVTPQLTLISRLGRRWIDKGHDRTFWEVGGRAQAKHAAFELRYVGTDLSRAQCNYPRADCCSPAVVGTLILQLPYVPVG